MKTYSFYEFDKKISEKLHIPDIPIPIKTENKKSIFSKGNVAISLLLDDIGEFIAEHKEYNKTYKPIVTHLAHQTGLALGMKGKHEEAEELFQKGLEYDPDNVLLKAALAHALVMTEQDEKAYKLYKEIVDDPDVPVNPLLWILAARSAVKVEKFAKAHAILEDCVPFVSKQEKGFWEFYNEIGTNVGAIHESPLRLCDHCKTPLKPGAKFCGFCGKKTGDVDTKAKGEFCGGCGKSLTPGAKFCGGCGKTVT